ncbi:MAG TPA: hypothetical protein VK108_08205 [Pseudogracilibacillus sp.]|nr:hypothetical protein [Pseudogracilibacillus sp.]
MTKIDFRPFAPNGLLTDNQTRTLTAWFEGEKRNINQRGIAEAIGVSRNKLYSAFEKNADRPFDELPLKAVNKIIELYNEDIQQFKEQQKREAEETKTTKEKAEKLIKKVGE